MSSATPQDVEEPVASNLRQSFDEVPDNLWQDIQSNGRRFESQFNEQNIFRQQYYEAARWYFADAMDVPAQGRAIAKLFQRWQNVVEQTTRWVLGGDPDNPLDATLSWDPEGAGEAMVRPLRTDSFSNAQYSQTPTTAGQFNIIPDDTQGDGSVETATQNEQAWIIIGWLERLAGSEAPYDYLQADINDNVGVRREEFLMYQMEGRDTLKIAERFRGPLIVPPGFDLDVDVNVKTTNITTGLWPLGVEVIRADATEFGGVLG